MTTVRTAAALIAGLTLATAPVLTACEQDTPSSDSSTSAASDSSADSNTSDTKDKDEEASADPTDAPAKPGSGETQDVTGSATGLTFAVPKDWEDLKNLDSAAKERVAQSMGTDTASLDQQTSGFDVFYRAKKPSSTGFYNNVNMASQTLLLTSTPSEFDITSLLTPQRATLKKYSTRQASTGEAAVGTYTITTNGREVQGTIIMVPTSKPAAGYANYATLYVSAGTEDEVEQITNTIFDTLH